MNREAERKRLVELLNTHQDYGTKYFYSENCQNISSTSNEIIADCLLDNGIVVPPVKVGDKVYELNTTYTPFVSNYVVEDYGIPVKNILGYWRVIPFDEIGKTVFTSREDAEKALKGESEK